MASVALFSALSATGSPTAGPPVSLRTGYVVCSNAENLRLFLDMPLGERNRADEQPWQVRFDVNGVPERRSEAQEGLRLGTCVLTSRLNLPSTPGERPFRFKLELRRESTSGTQDSIERTTQPLRLKEAVQRQSQGASTNLGTAGYAGGTSTSSPPFCEIAIVPDARGGDEIRAL